MTSAFELAGFFAAHAVWCVSDGETLVTMLAYDINGQRGMDRLIVSDDLVASVEYGRQQLDRNERAATAAALLFDGRIQMANTKSDAVIVTVCDYEYPENQVVIAVPYRSAANGGLFKVFQPRVMAWQECPAYDLDAAMQAFFRGIGGHEKGAPIWVKAMGSLDE